MNIIIQQDGGCSPNPGKMYGSYSLKFDGVEAFRASRVELGHGTNNEAEFLILIEAIKTTIDILESAGIEPKVATVQILTDSTIVRNRVSCRMVDSPRTLAKRERKWPGSAQRAIRMGQLAQDCITPLKRFRSYTIEWHARENNVEAFGH